MDRSVHGPQYWPKLADAERYTVICDEPLKPKRMPFHLGPVGEFCDVGNQSGCRGVD